MWFAGEENSIFLEDQKGLSGILRVNRMEIFLRQFCFGNAILWVSAEIVWLARVVIPQISYESHLNW